MEQFGTSAFTTVVRWHKLGEVENEYTAEKLVLFAISQSVKIWQSSDKK